jgi:hypothetical protein
MEFAATVRPAAAALKSRAKRDHAERDDWAPSKNKQTKLPHSRSSGSGVPDDSLGIAVRRAAEAISKRLRQDAVGRSQEAERDNDVSFVLNRLRNVYWHRRRPLLAARLARERRP